MNLRRLAFVQHPRPPQRELRQRGVFDSGDGLLGHIANIYVDEERNYRFVDVAMSGSIGLGRKHRLVPVEALAEGDSAAITLRVDRHTVEGAPTLETRTRRRMRSYSEPPASTAAWHRSLPNPELLRTPATRSSEKFSF